MSRLIGITGKMAAGKSFLIEKLKSKNLDCVFIDVDQFRRDLFNNMDYVAELKSTIFELNSYAEINSIVLNQYIYEDEKYMEAYKKILYKYLFAYLDSFERNVIVEWALILQDNLADKFTKIVYVDTNDEVILERLVDGDLEIEEVKKRLSLQASIDTFTYREQDNFLFVDGENPNISEVVDFIRPMECKFTIPEDGGKAIWEITHQCNYHCSYCIFACNGKKIPGELSTTECFKVIDELVKNGFKYLKVTGGEPFLRGDIIEILDYASKRMIVDVSTNASLITEEIVEKLNGMSLKMIHVSLDGNLLEHETVRGINTYLRTIRGLSYLRRSKNKVRIGSVIHKLNENTLEELVDDCENLGADEVIFSIMEAVNGRGSDYVKTKSCDELDREIKSIKNNGKYKIEVNYNFGDQPNYVCSCPGGDRFIYINHLGQISPCTWLAEKDSNFISKGSIKDNDFDELLEEDNLKVFRKNKKKGFCYGKI